MDTPPTPPTPPTPATPTPAVTPAAPAAPAAAAPEATPMITFDDFKKLDLRVGVVLECRNHENADKLLVMQVDVGGEKRQICAGVRAHYQPEQLVGKQIIVVANLAARQIRGQASQGMMLCASDPASGKVIFLSPSEAAASGSKVS